MRLRSVFQDGCDRSFCVEQAVQVIAFASPFWRREEVWLSAERNRKEKESSEREEKSNVALPPKHTHRHTHTQRTRLFQSLRTGLQVPARSTTRLPHRPQRWSRKDAPPKPTASESTQVRRCLSLSSPEPDQLRSDSWSHRTSHTIDAAGRRGGSERQNFAPLVCARAVVVVVGRRRPPARPLTRPLPPLNPKPKQS
jgi:hypothetical protein